MEININNYESFAIDYIDGNLNAVDAAKFILFLEQHPEIKSELEDMDTTILIPNDDFLINKEQFKIQGFDVKMDTNLLMVNFVEGIASEVEVARLNNLIHASASHARELRIFEQTRLVPNITICFPQREKLKRSGNKKYYWYYAAAAVLLAAWWLPSYFDNNSNTVASADAALQVPAKITTTTIHPFVMEKKMQQSEKQVQQLKFKDKQKAPLAICSVPLLNQIVCKKVPSVPLALIPKLPVTENLLELANLQTSTENSREATKLSSVPQQEIFSSPVAVVIEKLNRSSINVVTVKNGANNKQKNEREKLDLFAFLVNTYSKVSGKKMQIKKVYASDGNLTEFAFVSSKFEFSKSR